MFEKVVAVPQGCCALFGFQFIRYIFICFLNMCRVGSSLMFVGILFKALAAE